MAEEERRLYGLVLLGLAVLITWTICTSGVAAWLYHRAIGRSNGMLLLQWSEITTLLAWNLAILAVFPYVAVFGTDVLDLRERSALFVSSLVVKESSQIVRTCGWVSAWLSVLRFRQVSAATFVRGIFGSR